MKAAFFHDTPMLFDDNNKAYSIGFDYSIWKRYLTVFDSLTIATRKTYKGNKNNMRVSSGEKVGFNPIVAYSDTKDFFLKKEQIKRQIEEVINKVDCLIIRLPSVLGLLAIKYAKKNKVPYLIEVVGCTWDSYWNYGSFFGKIVAPYSFLKHRILIKESKYVIYITKNFLQKRYPTMGEYEVCPNVNIPPVENDIYKKRIDKIEESNGQLVFGLIGSLDVSYKGHEVVIKALARIKDELPDFRIEFLGKGNPEKWEKLGNEYNVLDKMVFKGILQNGEPVFKWMDKVDIALQPSSAEAQGRSIIEYMSRGCPVIATQVGGIVELIDQSCLVKPGDTESLADKILILSKDKELQKEQACKNFKESKNYYQNKINVTREEFLKKFQAEIKEKKVIL